MVNVIAPVEQGFVRSFARPGENITGFTNFEIQFGSKMLQLLKEIDPRIVRVGAIYNPKTAPYARLHVGPMEAAAARLGVETVTMMVHSDSDIEAAITELARRPGGGLAVVPDTFLSERREVIIGLVGRMRLPAVYGNLYYTRSGGLMAYAVDQIDTMYRAADYIDRILRGALPADLPVQQPTKFEFVINLKTAKALGLTIPETLLATADEVIQ
jgi:putative ABC transport system substrate-binding protein